MLCRRCKKSNRNGLWIRATDEVEAVIQKHGGLEEVNEDMTDLEAFREFMMSRFMRKGLIIWI